MKSDIARYVARCQVCIKTKPLQRPATGLMLSKSPSTTKPWQVLSVDLIGPLPRSSSGLRFIFSVLDVFSKYCLFFPLRSSTASKVVQWLEDHVFLIYGVPDRLIADNGPQFRSKIFRDVLKRYGVKLCFTANYHPQANPVERVHRVLKTIISGYVEDNHKN